MPALLQAPGQAGWPHLQRLLLALLRFMEPYLRNADLIEAVRVLYKARPRALGDSESHKLTAVAAQCLRDDQLRITSGALRRHHLCTACQGEQLYG